MKHFKDIKNFQIFSKKIHIALLSKLVIHSSPGLVILKLLTDQMSKYTEVLGIQSSHSVRRKIQIFSGRRQGRIAVLDKIMILKICIHIFISSVHWEGLKKKILGATSTQNTQILIS